MPTATGFEDTGPRLSCHAGVRPWASPGHRDGAYDPNMVDYDATTALLVVDVQNDFADPAGSLYVSGGERLVEVVNGHVDRAARAGAIIVYTQDWHPGSTPHFQKDGGVWPVHCVGGTWGAQLQPSLRVVEHGDVIRKGTGGEDGYSAFSVRDPQSGVVSGTELDDLLRRSGVRGVVVVGLATDYCVKETALDAVRRGLEATVVRDAVAAVDLEAGDGARALDEMDDAGVVLSDS